MEREKIKMGQLECLRTYFGTGLEPRALKNSELILFCSRDRAGFKELVLLAARELGVDLLDEKD